MHDITAKTPRVGESAPSSVPKQLGADLTICEPPHMRGAGIRPFELAFSWAWLAPLATAAFYL